MSRRATLRWYLIALLAWPLHALAWDYTPGGIPGLVGVLGFLTVQAQALDRAIQRYPGQREDLIRARTQFDDTFPQALAHTRRLIAGIPLADDERQLLIERVLDVLVHELAHIMFPDHAESFLELSAALRQQHESVRTR